MVRLAPCGIRLGGRLRPGCPNHRSRRQRMAHGSAELPMMLPTPREIIAHLDKYVHGQTRAKKHLATAVYNHYIGTSYAESPEAKYGDLERQHILLLGSTGSGKTHIVRTLADFLGVPVSTSSATSFAEVGYAGDHVESLISNLLLLTNGDVAKAQRGIVFLDEVDKIKRGETMTRDVSGEGVQAGLLQLLDGRMTTIRSGGSATQIDVSKILFICAGAFVGLADTIRDRLRLRGGGGIGFARATLGEQEETESLSEDELIERCETSDLVNFGLIPEFIGRFAEVTSTRSLSRQDLLDIMTRVEGSPIAKQKMFFALHGIELEFNDEAMDELAIRAEALRTGARGLRRVVLRALDPVDHRVPDLAAEGVRRIVITRATVRDGADPIMERSASDAAKTGSTTPADVLRLSALVPAAIRGRFSNDGKPLPAGVSDSANWSDQQVAKRIVEMKNVGGWSETTGSARQWWSAFEAENKDRSRLVLRLLEELAIRNATITEFFLSYVYSNTDNIQANLHYLDYTRLKKEEERKKAGERRKRDEDRGRRRDKGPDGDGEGPDDEA